MKPSGARERPALGRHDRWFKESLRAFVGDLLSPGVVAFEIVSFQDHASGLSRATAEDWLKRTEPLAPALASLTKSGTLRPAEQKLACLQGIARAELDEARRFLLVNAVETS